MKYRRDAFHVLFFIGMSSIAFSVSASSTGIIHFSGKILEPSCYAGQVDPKATDKGYLVCWHEAGFVNSAVVQNPSGHIVVDDRRIHNVTHSNIPEMRVFSLWTITDDDVTPLCVSGRI